MTFCCAPGDDPLAGEHALDDEPAQPEGVLVPLDEGPSFEAKDDDEAESQEPPLVDGFASLPAGDDDDALPHVEAPELGDFPPMDDEPEDGAWEEQPALEALPALDGALGEEDLALPPLGPLALDDEPRDLEDEEDDFSGPPPGEQLH